MADCEAATPVIPTYTPISTFTGDNYNPLGAQSGVFLGCFNNGIKVRYFVFDRNVKVGPCIYLDCPENTSRFLLVDRTEVKFCFYIIG